MHPPHLSLDYLERRNGSTQDHAAITPARRVIMACPSRTDQDSGIGSLTPIMAQMDCNNIHRMEDTGIIFLHHSEWCEAFSSKKGG